MEDRLERLGFENRTPYYQIAEKSEPRERPNGTVRVGIRVSTKPGSDYELVW